MAERIYVLDGDRLEPMEEQRFELEDHLQKLLAEHPHVLDGEQVGPGNPRRWLLVKREKGVSAEAAESDRWSLDHLFVDQDAVPTLVEVKRGSNTELRRKVVGQMLDYAANASQFWTREALRQSFEETWGDSADEALRNLLQSDDEEPNADGFWDRVAGNLAAKRLRLLFVADAIPTELARIVEFLNAQLRDNVEVLAIEVKQFKGGSEARRTLVPRVIGHTAAPPSKRDASRKQTRIDRDSFLGSLPGDDVRRATMRIHDVADEYGAHVIRNGKGLSIRVKIPGKVHSRFCTVAWLFPPSASSFWAGLRDYSFGVYVDPEIVPKLPSDTREALDAWVNQFENDSFGKSHRGPYDVRARIIAHEDVATHVETLVDRLGKVLGDLQRSLQGPR